MVGGFVYLGIIEGFYGRPFSQRQRKILLEELSVLDSSAYFYAPKNDPWHRILWREPYPDHEWTSLTDCMGGSTSFFFSVSPWQFGDEEWRIAREKLLRAEDSGAVGLGILFDDVPEDSAAILAERQISFARNALSGTGATVVLCPSVYCGEFIERYEGGGQYLETWRKLIPGDWHSFWTGPQVVSEELSGLDEAEKLLGGKPVIWDNLLATDYCLRRIFLSGLTGRQPADCWWFLNPSEIFPAALHGVMELKAAVGCPREWPDALGEHSRGWELMQEFHYSPWRPGETGGEILSRLSGAVEGRNVQDASAWLEEAVREMTLFTENLSLIEGGWELLPVARDLYRSMSILKRALLSPDPKEALNYLMHIRLPYENPMAVLAGKH
jgi:hypothetical protein